MELQRINLKIAFEQWDGSAEDVFKIFNRWISTTTDEVLIDVADYRHVHNGPETLLVGHNANYSFDNSGGDLGLLYCQKRGLDGSLTDRLEKVFTSTLSACKRLEAEPELQGNIRFDGGDTMLVANDRLIAPNTEAVRKRILEELEPFLGRLYGSGEFAIEEGGNEAERPSFHIVTETGFGVDSLLENIAQS